MPQQKVKNSQSKPGCHDPFLSTYHRQSSPPATVDSRPSPGPWSTLDHHPQGYQWHLMPFLPHMSTACTPLCPIPLVPRSIRPQSVPLYTPKYPAPSCPPVPHTQPHISYTLLRPAPWTPRLCLYVPPNPCSAPSCLISLKTLLCHPHILLHPTPLPSKPCPYVPPYPTPSSPTSLQKPLHPTQISDPSRFLQICPASRPSACSSSTSHSISVRSHLSSQK